LALNRSALGAVWRCVHHSLEPCSKGRCGVQYGSDAACYPTNAIPDRHAWKTVLSSTPPGEKVVVITGASRGIGAGLVTGFLDSGFRVVANARSILQGDDPDVLAIAGDIAERATALRIVAGAIGRFGRLDTLVNSAGLFVSKALRDYTPADISAAIAVNVAGFFHITQIAATHMLVQGSGHVINITYGMAGRPTIGLPTAIPSLTLGGLEGLTRSLAREFAGRGVRVNAVSVGLLEVDALARQSQIRDVVDAALSLEIEGIVTGRTRHVRTRRDAGQR
jgi:NAD(P)-dependent dehydrogenase (short-subunit alcohol dehydrogenase family)